MDSNLTRRCDSTNLGFLRELDHCGGCAGLIDDVKVLAEKREDCERIIRSNRCFEMGRRLQVSGRDAERRSDRFELADFLARPAALASPGAFAALLLRSLSGIFESNFALASLHINPAFSRNFLLDTRSDCLASDTRLSTVAPCQAQGIGELHLNSLIRPPTDCLRREQDKEATVYIGNLDERVSDSLVWELMLQAGRIVNVHLPKDRVTQAHQGYGFVEFISEEDAEYAARIMNQVRLYGKPIRVNKASADKQKTMEVGAELFVGNLDPMVTEQVLYDTFSRFGALLSLPKVCFSFFLSFHCHT